MEHTAGIVHNGLNAQLDYGYDGIGNIVSESCDLDGNTNEYRYDKLGQLIRASVRNDATCGANGTTWVYTYDLGGNILKKEAYPKLTDIDNELPASPAKVVNYTYDAEWKDLLVSCHDTSEQAKTIQYTPDTLPQMPDGMTYFHMGNPYKYDGWTYEWQVGRQLKSMTHKNEQGGQDKKLEFAYDAAALRTQKKYTYTDAQGWTVIETTDYILHGKLLMHQKTATTVNGVQQGEPYQLHFYYDKDSRPSMVRVGNEEAQSKYYAYVCSPQGDVLGFIDRNQDLVVKYAYSPWGEVLETRSLTTECEKLAELNPFRYKGYVHDAETGLYYLRSRYYSPEWGRFLNIDRVDNSVGQILGHNYFAYCFNNPVALTDSEGTWPGWLDAVVAVAVAVVAIAAVVVAAPAAICMATVSLTAMGLASTTAAVVATAGITTAGMVAGAAIGDQLGVALTGYSVVKEEILGGNEAAYEAFQFAGYMATAGVIGLGVMGNAAGVCFVAGTPVMTENGLKPIEDIRAGDLVWAMDPDTGEKALKEVKQTFVRETDELLHLFVGDDEIVTTPEHPFFVKDIGWVAAKELHVADALELRDGTDEFVTSILYERLVESRTVYNFEVEGYHTYHVGSIGVLVHNSCKHGSEWAKERRSYWKGQAKANADVTGRSPSGTYKVTNDNLSLMNKGAAPYGTDGLKVNLHHTQGIAANMRTYQEVLGSYHRQNYKALHPWLFK